jgi:hypothetical protein
MALMRSLQAILKDQPDDALGFMERGEPVLDPEIVLYFATNYAQIGGSRQLSLCVRRRSWASYVHKTLREDPWIASLRKNKRYPDLLENLKP